MKIPPPFIPGNEIAGEVLAIGEGVEGAAFNPGQRVSGTTFGAFADNYLKSILPGFKGAKAGADWRRDLEMRCKPIRPKRLGEITTEDVLVILSPLWLTMRQNPRGYAQAKIPRYGRR